MNKAFEGWAIVELMGHVRLAGYVTEEEHFGSKLGRIDIPLESGPVTTLFGGSSVYRVTPCSEVLARHEASKAPKPVSEWEIKHILDRGPKLIESSSRPLDFDEDDDEPDDEEVLDPIDHLFLDPKPQSPCPVALVGGEEITPVAPELESTTDSQADRSDSCASSDVTATTDYDIPF